MSKLLVCLHASLHRCLRPWALGTLMMCGTGPLALAQLPPPPPGAYDAAPYLGQIRNENVYGDVWERPGLSPRDRSMITVAVTQALNASSELRLHMGRALDNGLTPVEIEETLAQVRWYAALPAEVDGAAIAAEVFAERGLSGSTATASSAPSAERPDATVPAPFPQNPALSARDRSLVTVALASAQYASGTLRVEVARALDNGVTQDELAEVIVHIAFYSGFPTAVNASRVAAEVLAERGRQLGASRFPGAPYLETLIDGLVFGDTWTRTPLTPRERSLAVIAVTLAAYQSDQLRTHLARGLDNGLSVQEIAELIAQVTLYSGFPSGINASRIFGEVLRERGLPLPTLAQGPDLDQVRVTRLLDQPIIAPGIHPSIGANIQGPSLVKVPEWLENPLGKYYLYFADHKGDYIRLAYADALTGPWQIHAPGSLQIEESLFLVAPPTVSDERVRELEAERLGNGVRYAHDLRTELTSPHIASPDVHIDHVNQRFIMYYHGLADVGRQHSRVATSRDGIHFEAQPQNLGRTYMRAFAHEGMTYVMAMPGQFYRSQDGMTDFETGPLLFESTMRHAALLKRGNTLYVFWTRVGDVPESILVSTVDLSGDWQQWRNVGERVVLQPEFDWEGANAPLEPSVRSTAYGVVNQLRDPAIHVEGDDIYLLYAVGGESGIALAKIELGQTH